MAESPFILRSGMARNPVVQRVAPLPPEAAVAIVVPRMPNGSGEAVEDSFHRILQ